MTEGAQTQAEPKRRRVPESLKLLLEETDNKFGISLGRTLIAAVLLSMLVAILLDLPAGAIMWMFIMIFVFVGPLTVHLSEWVREHDKKVFMAGRKYQRELDNAEDEASR